MFFIFIVLKLILIIQSVSQMHTRASNVGRFKKKTKFGWVLHHRRSNSKCLRFICAGAKKNIFANAER